MELIQAELFISAVRLMKNLDWHKRSAAVAKPIFIILSNHCIRGGSLVIVACRANEGFSDLGSEKYIVGIFGQYYQLQQPRDRKSAIYIATVSGDKNGIILGFRLETKGSEGIRVNTTLTSLGTDSTNF